MIFSALMTPTFGFFALFTPTIARVRSYSSSFSRSGLKNGIASVRLPQLTARPR